MADAFSQPAAIEDEPAGLWEPVLYTEADHSNEETDGFSVSKAERIPGPTSYRQAWVRAGQAMRDRPELIGCSVRRVDGFSHA